MLIVTCETEVLQLVGKILGDTSHSVVVRAYVLAEPYSSQLRHLRHDDIAHAQSLAEEIGHGSLYVSVVISAEEHIPLFACADGIHPPRGEEQRYIVLPPTEVYVLLFVRHCRAKLQKHLQIYKWDRTLCCEKWDRLWL